MTDWSRVKWSEAGQIAKILGWKADALPDAAAPPQAAFEALVAAGRFEDAVDYLSQALPRLEAVAWAARCVRDLKPETDDTDGPEARALRTALLWVRDPTEERRRAAADAADRAEGRSPEVMAALAVFYSGGSIAPTNCEPLPAPRDAAGLFVAGAVLIAAGKTKDHEGALQECLVAGAKIAAQGIDAE